MAILVVSEEGQMEATNVERAFSPRESLENCVGDRMLVVVLSRVCSSSSSSSSRIVVVVAVLLLLLIAMLEVMDI